MNVTVLSSDLSDNCLGRALVLAKVLAQHHEVQIVGSRFGREIWPPAAERAIPIVEVAGYIWPAYGCSIRRLFGLLEGDVVIAVKPLFPSLGVALLFRRLTGTPVILDIDDDETALSPIPPPFRLPSELLKPDNALTRRAMGRFVKDADAVTVASSVLQRRYGGHLVRHAKDTKRLYPGAGDGIGWRRRMRLHDVPIILFLGTPRPWKGLEDAAEAVSCLGGGAKLIVVGADESPYSRLVATLPGVLTFGMVAIESIQDILSAADVVIVPQRATPITQTQMPSKLFDAMAMGKAVVATAVADIPAVLGEERGRVVPPGDVPAMTAALRELLGDPGLAARLGEAARSWCVRNASLEAAGPPMDAALTAASRRRAS